ncbi:MAG: SulP family inorganic anion transporter [Nitrospinaceae bacterium]|nr:SulP family inorganic anion transporter [Nitrospinaceae bacterium]|tara:strand:+ start:97 stop:1695 length:1599 start_codon:yes stop_codon:yes gene_type:complete
MSLSSDHIEVPKGNLDGFKTHTKHDILSGFLVFLIALPLCLGISLASGYPAVAGIFTAIVGGLVATFISDSELTIKGPAAGLIVIALGCVQDFGFTGGVDPAKDFQAYRMALGVGVVAGVYQIILGLFRVGILVNLFPKAAIHGLLASIGIIIISKQFPVLMGLNPQGSPLELLAGIPSFIINMNPKVGMIGIMGIIIVLGYGYIKNPKLKIIPAPMLMLLITVPIGTVLAVGVEGSYTFNNHIYKLGQNFLVNVPGNLLNAVTFPDFSGITTETGIKYTVLFAIIGSLEGVLSAKAIDGIDPWGRKTNLDRDLLATGIANTMSAFIGGLPMISEIVRSKANIDNGAKTRFANFYHGMFLLICVALVPSVINQIPLAALAALLVITGYRLASPHEFMSIYREGKDQFIVFVSTILGVLATDLLKGLAIGIGVRIVIHFIRGGSIFRLNAKIIPERDQSVTIFLRGSIIFSSWIPLRQHLQRFLKKGKRVTLDITETKLVDRRVMSRVGEWKKKFKENGLELSVRSRVTSIDE